MSTFLSPSETTSLHRFSDQSMNVLLAGPSLTQNGGMATVQALIVEGATAEGKTEVGRIEDTRQTTTQTTTLIEHITTHDEGSAAHRVKTFLQGLLQYVQALGGTSAYQDSSSKKQRRPIDVVHMHMAERGSVWRSLFLLLIAKAFKTPFIIHHHGCEFHTFHDALPAPIQAVTDKLLRLADRHIALSESWKTYYLDHCGLSSEQVVVLPNPTEIPTVVPDRNGSGPVQFAFLGRIGQRKGAFDLIQAFAQLPDEIRGQAELFLAGDGEIDTAKALAKELNLTEPVKFLGWISAAERNQLLKAADVFILPSYNEGLPMAMLEAMSWALPVISTTVGGIPEFIDEGDTGYLIEPGSLPMLTAAMSRLIEDGALRQEMGQRARERVQPLDIKLYCDRLNEIYADVASENAR